MANASVSTVRADEAAHFGKLAAEWWNPNGSSAMLHKLNPVRLGYMRAQIDTHFDCDARALRPLAGKSALDVGCGAGLLCEPLARMGATVTGIDAAPENIAAAQSHAAAMGLPISYHAGDFTHMDLPRFDLVTSMEVIEHVVDPAAFLAALTARLAPDGLMILSTPNRTAASKLFLIELAERSGQIPRGTHHWDQFITPEELGVMLVDCGLEVVDLKGIAFSPATGLTISDRLDLNYILAVRHAR